ncbi:protein-tyrosine-phosphatase [Actinoplanes capillaceus]|uniref:Protein-tyrosine-phosphatase n=1 Tax=Actinoplanes campanulatus TaxID=113559 RepID=A0ABQ3WQ65_9ACTN|nr:ABC transporter ATP-binding protein [Actinoplanes capillaceus]GID48430.1 protein-tyrosine-phosphatase [Actinoplanes capillaceus]
MLKAAWRFRGFLRPHAPALGAGALLVVLGTLLTLAQPWPLQVIVDGVVGGRPQNGWLPTLIAGSGADRSVVLIRALAATVLLVGLSALTGYISDLLMNRSGARIIVTIRGALFAHVQRLSLSFHLNQRVGDLVARLTTDIDRSQNMLVAIFGTLIPNAVMLAGLAVVMVLVEPSFGLLALSIAPPLFLVTYHFTRKIRRASRSAREADAGLAAMTSETLGAIRVVQAFGREGLEDDRFAGHSRESLTAGLRAIKLRAGLPPLVDLVSLAGTLLVTYVGVQRVLDGRMSLGVLLVFLSYLRSLYRPMRALSKMSYVVSQGVASAERVDAMLRTDDTIRQARGARPVRRLRGRVELRDVTFAYGPAKPRVLNAASLAVEPGEHVGIVGRTGAGKSTLISLIPRFYDPQAGSILLDGMDIRELHLTDLRRQISLVLQEPFLFYGTILDNIRYGDPTASLDRVWEAATRAHVTEFLDRLPQGLDTRIGERGGTLSGGQRQRIAIARAMLHDAPILILDEPTTGLDRDSEALVLDGLHRLTRNRTTFVISHHPAALARVDRIVEVRDGHLLPPTALHSPPGIAAEQFTPPLRVPGVPRPSAHDFPGSRGR